MEEYTINNIKAQMRKGFLEYCMLMILQRGRAYPSDIISSLRNAGMEVVEGSLYTILNRLRKENKLDYEWEESKSGPPRKYYTLTETGKEFLGMMSTVWDDLSASVAKFRNR